MERTRLLAAVGLTEILLASAVILIFNWWEHFPPIVPNHYTDVSSVFWRDGIGKSDHQLPYVQYTFEYPVLVGFFVYVCSGLARAIDSNFSVAMNYYTLFMDVILVSFAIGTVYYLYRICSTTGKDLSRIWKTFLIAPSFLMFPLYNWDIIAIFFTMLAIWYSINNHGRYAAASLGLGMAAKLYPGILVPVLMAEAKTLKERLTLLGTAAGVFGALNAPLMVVNFSGWWQTWAWHMNWGLEDSWLIFFFNQFDKNAHYVGLAIMIYLLYKGLIETSKKNYNQSSDKIFERSMLMNLAWLLGSYVVTPQMALILLPFYVLVPQIPLSLIYLVEIFNALIIVLWFREMDLGKSPLIASSPVQWFSAIRQIIWLGFFIYLIYPKRTAAFAKSLLRRIGE